MRKDYLKEMSKFKKSILIVFVFVLLLSVFFTIIIMNFLEGDYSILLNNAISIAVGCFSTLLLDKVRSVQKEGKSFLYKIKRDNKDLMYCICELDLLLDKIYFVNDSGSDTFPIIEIYEQFQYLKTDLNNDIFDNVSIIGLNSLFDEIKSLLLNLKNKKDLSENIDKLKSLVEKIKEIINEQIKNNNVDKDIFLNEEEKFYKLVSVKTKKKS